MLGGDWYEQVEHYERDQSALVEDCLRMIARSLKIHQPPRNVFVTFQKVRQPCFVSAPCLKMMLILMFPIIHLYHPKGRHSPVPTRTSPEAAPAGARDRPAAAAAVSGGRLLSRHQRERVHRLGRRGRPELRGPLPVTQPRVTTAVQTKDRSAIS